jgi:hypothetical protein
MKIVSADTVIGGGLQVTIHAQKPDLRLARSLTAVFARNHASRLVVVHTVVPELSVTFGTEVTLAAFKCGLYGLATTAIMVDKSVLSQMAGATLNANLPREQPRRVTMATDVESLKKLSS